MAYRYAEGDPEALVLVDQVAIIYLSIYISICMCACMDVCVCVCVCVYADTFSWKRFRHGHWNGYPQAKKKNLKVSTHGAIAIE